MPLGGTLPEPPAGSSDRELEDGERLCQSLDVVNYLDEVID